MKIVVVGGSGLIGSKLVNLLRQGGHDVVSASLASGVNTITGEGLDEAMAGTQVVVDVTNSPSFEDKAVLEFFETSGRNIIAAGELRITPNRERVNENEHGSGQGVQRDEPAKPPTTPRSRLQRRGDRQPTTPCCADG
jgi:uncharacterized protein YbjT (DUF2867 family)